MIKAVTFDCWDTLLEDDPSRSNAMKEYFANLFVEDKVPVDAEKIDVYFSDELVLFENHVKANRKTLDARARAETLLNLAGIELPETRILEIAAYCNTIALSHPPPVIPQAEAALKSLSEDYKLALICNTGWHSGLTVRKLLENDSLAGYFSCFSFSDEVGVAKPHQRIFEITLGKLGCRPDEAVHIGDSEYSDIIGAKRSYMHAILFTGVNRRFAEDNSADVTIDTYEGITDVIADFAS